MTAPDIQKEWDSFIEYPERSNKMYVTTTSALLFARHIAYMAADKEREACAKACEETRIVKGGEVFAAKIRARGNT